MMEGEKYFRVDVAPQRAPLLVCALARMLGEFVGAREGYAVYRWKGALYMLKAAHPEKVEPEPETLNELYSKLRESIAQNSYLFDNDELDEEDWDRGMAEEADDFYTAECESCGMSRQQFIENYVLLDRMAWAARDLYSRYKERLHRRADTHGIQFTEGEHAAMQEMHDLLDEYRVEHLDGSWDEEG